jgi:RNA polymerase sigma-70 factor (ECF subfamily)
MGDAAAFHRLFTEYFTPLRGFVLSYVKDPAVAEELVQDLFCGLWRQREQWAPQGRIRHYLLAAARNRALSYLRHQRIVDRTSQQWVAPRGSEGCPGMGGSPLGPDQLLEAAELGEACRRAIHALPERRRLVVTLRWQHQLSHAEIARILGISVKGVEAQLSRALKSLRHLLADLLPEAVNRQQ